MYLSRALKTLLYISITVIPFLGQIQKVRKLKQEHFMQSYLLRLTLIEISLRLCVINNVILMHPIYNLSVILTLRE